MGKETNMEVELKKKIEKIRKSGKSEESAKREVLTPEEVAAKTVVEDTDGNDQYLPIVYCKKDKINMQREPFSKAIEMFGDMNSNRISTKKNYIDSLKKDDLDVLHSQNKQLYIEHIIHAIKEQAFLSFYNYLNEVYEAQDEKIKTIIEYIDIFESLYSDIQCFDRSSMEIFLDLESVSAVNNHYRTNNGESRANYLTFVSKLIVSKLMLIYTETVDRCVNRGIFLSNIVSLSNITTHYSEIMGIKNMDSNNNEENVSFDEGKFYLSIYIKDILTSNMDSLVETLENSVEHLLNYTVFNSLYDIFNMYRFVRYGEANKRKG